MNLSDVHSENQYLLSGLCPQRADFSVGMDDNKQTHA